MEKIIAVFIVGKYNCFSSFDMRVRSWRRRRSAYPWSFRSGNSGCDTRFPLCRTRLKTNNNIIVSVFHKVLDNYQLKTIVLFRVEQMEIYKNSKSLIFFRMTIKARPFKLSSSWSAGESLCLIHDLSSVPLVNVIKLYAATFTQCRTIFFGIGISWGHDLLSLHPWQIS